MKMPTVSANFGPFLDNHKYIMTNDKENITLKKIRYYQGTIKDFDTFWQDKIKESQKESKLDLESRKKKNDELNKSYKIIPVDNE